MAKKKNTNEKMTAIIDVKIAVPAQVADIVKTSDGEQGKLYILFNRNTTQLSADIAIELASSRRVPLQEETVGISDPLAILLMAQSSTLVSQEIVFRVKQHYRQELSQVNEDALMLALTDNNDFDIPLVPYSTEEDEKIGTLTTSEVVPSWRSSLKQVILPKTKRNLENPYEARLKILSDFLGAAEQADPFFTAEFKRLTDESFAQMVRGLSGETDKAGFQPKPVS